MPQITFWAKYRQPYEDFWRCSALRQATPLSGEALAKINQTMPTNRSNSGFIALHHFLMESRVFSCQHHHAPLDCAAQQAIHPNCYQRRTCPNALRFIELLLPVD